jgi:ectoine hydroxylase-related dioxygenase (phytanoyl-CoA dioxygenase family)
MTRPKLWPLPRAKTTIAKDWADQLRSDGYCLIPGAAAGSQITATWSDLRERFERTPFCEGDFYGRGTKRFGSVLKHSPSAAALVMNPLILAIVDEVLGPHCDTFQLNLAQALEIYPGQAAQAPHRDEDMWGGPKGEVEYLVNVMWPFSSYTEANGATRIYPTSHRRRDDEALLAEGPIAMAMEPGSALLFLGSTLHGGGANQSRTRRTGLIVSYCLGWLKPFENQWLVYPPAVARRFDRELARMVGYQQHRPNLGNVEGQCPSVLLDGQLSDYLAATDNLKPDQACAVAKWRAAIGATT